MAVRRRRSHGLLALTVAMGALALDGSAFAQGAAPAAPVLPHPPAPPTASSTPATPPAEAGEPPAAQPSTPAAASESTPVEALPELPPAASEAALPATEESAPAADEDWYDAFDVRLFADAYFNLNYNFPKPQSRTDGGIRAFDSANGFSLAWAGLDISHAADPVGGTLGLRFGPSAKRYNSSCLSSKCDADYGLENIKQAFASWRPGGEGSPVSIDFGKFDTIYGAEVAESQDNINYTRGVLYWLGQPAFHTGLRVNADLTANFGLRALVVNGWNNTVDNNSGKTFGLQATVHAPRADGHDLIAASLGYLGGGERDDTATVTCMPGNVFDPGSPTGCSASTAASPTSGVVDRGTSDSKGWRHFVDLVVTTDPIDALHVVLNADFGTEKVRDPLLVTRFTSQKWWGAMLGARYLVTHAFAVGARGEYYRDDNGLTTGSVDGIAIGAATIVTGTVTLDYLPTKNLVLRLDTRLDHSDKQIFPKGVHSDDRTGTLVTSTLGVVVTTN